MRPTQKYAVSNIEILVDIMQRINYNPNPVTICTLKNILKGRAKRGDEDALAKYIKYSANRIFLTGSINRPSEEEIKQKLTEIFEEYIKETDVKKRDLNTSFEDFEDKYYFL